MGTAANEERSVRTAATAVVIDAAPRAVGSAAAAAEWLGLEVVARGRWVWAAPSLVERYRPDMLLIACDEIEACVRLVTQVRTVDASTRVVVVGCAERDGNHRRLLEAGALVVLTQAPRPPDDVASKMTSRELEISSLLASGLRNGEIAKQLWVTERTVKFHLSNVYRKLGVRSRAEAIAALQRTTRGG